MELAVKDLDHLYDVAALKLRMVGGPRCGETVTVPQHPGNPPSGYCWAVPCSLPSATDLALGWPQRQKIDHYAFTGRVAEDGARLFSYTGRS
jgi:hypothetical protein